MTDQNHSHYFKKIPEGMTHIDVYAVLSLFGVTDPTLQHAVKKLLCTGVRGHKDFEKDVQDAIDTLVRGQKLRGELKEEPKEEPKENDDGFNSALPDLKRQLDEILMKNGGRGYPFGTPPVPERSPYPYPYSYPEIPKYILRQDKVQQHGGTPVVVSHAESAPASNIKTPRNLHRSREL